MHDLRDIAVEATKNINALLASPLSEDQSRKIESIVEKAAIKALLQGHHHAIDAILKCPEADQDQAHKFANAVRRDHDALRANLSSLR